MRLVIIAIALLAATIGAISAETEVERLEADLQLAAPDEQVDLLNRLARATQNNDPQQSIEFARRALEVAEHLADRPGQARALNNIGVGHYFLADYPAALESYKSSLSIAQEMNDESAVANATNNIGILYYVWGNYDEALDHHDAVLALRLRIGDVKGAASAYNNLGTVHYATARYEESLEYFLEALPLYKTLE